MALSKKDLGRKSQNIKARIDELEKKARMDPMHKHPEIHDELERMKKKLAEG